MNQSTPAHTIRVGLFLAISLFVLAVSIIGLGGGKSLWTKKAKLYVDLPHAQGLNDGSIVSLAGLTIGNVSGVEYLPQSKNIRVQMRVESVYLSQLHQGATVEVRTQGALGDKFVYINPSVTEGETLKEGDVLQVNTARDLIGVLSEPGAEATKLAGIISETHKLLASFNANNRTESILKNLDLASASLRNSSQAADQFLQKLSQGSPEKLRATLENLESITRKMDNGQGSLGALLNDPSLHDRIKLLLGSPPRREAIQDLLRGSVERKPSGAASGNSK